MLTLFFSIALLGSSAMAVDIDSTVWVRNERNKIVEQDVVLTDLISAESADGLYFKIVEARGSDPIRFDDPELGQRAAHVYYHLMLSRNYFVNELNSSYVRNLAPVIVRLNMTDTFFHEFHWGHERFANNYNNAETIPPSNHMRYPGVQPWNNEIWFRPMKKIKAKSSLQRAGELLDSSEYKKHIRNNYIETSILNTVAKTAISGSVASATYELQYLLAMVTFVEGLPKLYKFLGKLFKRKMALDTAMIPEIIYHEFAHVALYDKLNFDGKTPVVEGLANFFAYRVLGHAKLGMKLGKYGRGVGGYNGERASYYTFANETKDYSHSSFLLHVLTSLDNVIPDFDKILYESRVHLNKDSDIKYSLVDALNQTVSEHHSENEQVFKLRITREFNNKGL
jgi:hypothetical protein